MDREARVLTPKEEKRLAKQKLTPDQARVVREAWEKEKPSNLMTTIIKFFALVVFVVVLTLNLFYGGGMLMDQVTYLVLCFMGVYMAMVTINMVVSIMLMAFPFGKENRRWMVEFYQKHDPQKLILSVTMELASSILLMLNGFELFAGLWLMFPVSFCFGGRFVLKQTVKKYLTDEVAAWKRAQASSTAGS